MKEAYMKLPDALKKEIWIRLILGIIFLFLFVALGLADEEIYLYLTSLLFGIFFFIKSAELFLTSILGKYICVQGICQQIETTGFRKRIKSICIKLEIGTLKIMIHRKIKDVAIGDMVVVYLSDKSPVYEQDGKYMISNYYTLKIEKGE